MLLCAQNVSAAGLLPHSLAPSCWGCQKIPLELPSSRIPGVHPDLVLCLLLGLGKSQALRTTDLSHGCGVRGDTKLSLPRGESHYSMDELSRFIPKFRLWGVILVVGCWLCSWDGSGYLIVLVFWKTPLLRRSLILPPLPWRIFPVPVPSWSSPRASPAGQQARSKQSPAPSTDRFWDGVMARGPWESWSYWNAGCGSRGDGVEATGRSELLFSFFPWQEGGLALGFVCFSHPSLQTRLL